MPRVAQDPVKGEVTRFPGGDGPSALAAWSAVTPYGIASLHNAGPHGLSEILYAYSSAAANNGSAFGGISANTGPRVSLEHWDRQVFGQNWISHTGR